MSFDNNELDLRCIKLAVFDFDDTLFIHSMHNDRDSDSYWCAALRYNDSYECSAQDCSPAKDMDIKTSSLSSVTEPLTTPWETTQPNIHMKRFIEYLRKINPQIQFGLCSAIDFPMIAEAKVKYTESVYGVRMRNYCSFAGEGLAKGKAMLLNVVCKAYNYKPSEILFVDDYPANRTAFADMGGIAISPMQVVNFVEQYCNYCPSVM